MSNLITIKKKNEVYLTVTCEPHAHRELADYFSFELPEAKFLKRQPRFRYWDGMIHLYSPGTGDLYNGLLPHLKLWCTERKYRLSYENNDWYGSPDEVNGLVSPGGVKVYMDKIGKYKPRDYQYATVYKALKYNKVNSVPYPPWACFDGQTALASTSDI